MITSITGPHSPVGGGRYHEQPSSRGGLGGGGTSGGGGGSGGGGRKPPDAGLEEAVRELRDELRENRKVTSSLKTAVDLLRSTVSESDVLPVPEADPKADGSSEATERPKRKRKPPPSSDPALTRLERKVKIATATIGGLIALSSALAVGIASAWSYIKGSGERAADAEDEQAEELSRLRKTRRLLELRAAYLIEVQDAIANHREIPSKPAELVAAEQSVDP